MRGSRLIPLLVAFSLLFISIVHACSGLRFVNVYDFRFRIHNESGMEADPCRKPSRTSASLFGIKCFLLRLRRP